MSTPGSIMPAYPWMFEKSIDVESTTAKISAMRTLGVPYPEGYEERAVDDMWMQANEIASNLEESGIQVSSDKEIIALIAYLQRLGVDIMADASKEVKPYQVVPKN